jgi:hypothetical protein
MLYGLHAFLTVVPLHAHIRLSTALTDGSRNSLAESTGSSIKARLEQSTFLPDSLSSPTYGAVPPSRAIFRKHTSTLGASEVDKWVRYGQVGAGQGS